VNYSKFPIILIVRLFNIGGKMGVQIKKNFSFS